MKGTKLADAIRKHPAWEGDHGFKGRQLVAWRKQRRILKTRLAKRRNWNKRKRQDALLNWLECPQRLYPYKDGTLSGWKIVFAAGAWLDGTEGDAAFREAVAYYNEDILEGGIEL